MDPKKEKNTNLGVGIGYVLQLAGFYLGLTSDSALVGLSLILISFPVFVWGCMNYAEGKHHSKWVGLAGLGGIIGLLILVVLPDRAPDAAVQRMRRRKIVGLLTLFPGLLLVVLGRWLDDLGGPSVCLEAQLQPWPGVCMFLGVCITLGSLVLILHDGRQR